MSAKRFPQPNADRLQSATKGATTRCVNERPSRTVGQLLGRLLDVRFQTKEC